MSIPNIFKPKALIGYLYGVFALNVISIFYLDRANNDLDDRTEFLATLILPVLIALVLAYTGRPLTRREIYWALAGLVIGGPVIFSLHIMATL